MTLPKDPIASSNKKALASQMMQDRILEVTIEILGTEGYAALTASKLSQRAGISKGALYHHFDNLGEVKLSALASLLDIFMQVEDPSLFAGLDEYLATTGDTLFAQMRQQPVAMKALYAFAFQAMVDESVKLQIRQLTEHSLDQYGQAIKHFCPTLSSRQLKQAVLVMDAYFAGTIIHWFLLEDPTACRAGWRMFSGVLLHSLKPGGK